jgi:N-acetylglucosaminyldiphosphoundecaprenol N-acetyl-beta-D-mannosaminyltransferase
MKYFIPITKVLGSPITSLRLEEQVYLMLTWAKKHKSKVICLANSHMLMEAYWNRGFAKVLQTADLVSPDGMPIVWMLRLMGVRHQNRVAGMDVFMSICRLASISNISVFCLGSRQEVLDLMKEKLEKEFPFLSIAGMEPLPFRPLTPEEDLVLIDKINSSNAGLIFVCLGCPKQENWMAEHKEKINGVMIGVGAVFSVYAELQKRAPNLIRVLGLEWLYRLIQDPQRLWTRYRKTIPPFLYLAAKELLNSRKPQELLRETNSDELIEEKDSQEINYQQDSNLELLKSARIGEILVRQNVISEACLKEALEEQKNYQDRHYKIGEILLNKGYINLNELEYYLNEQHLKLGNILLEKNLISHDTLDSILLEQVYRKQGLKISQNRQLDTQLN